MQMVGATVPKAVLSTMKSPYGARVPYAGSPHGNAATLSRRCLSSLTWGHDRPTTCECARVCKICVLLCLFFSVTAYCLISGHSPLSTWCLPLDEWLMCLSWWSRSDRTERSGKQRRTGWVCGRRRGGGERETKKVQCLAETLPCLPCDAVWIQVVHLKMPSRLADQEWKIGAVAKLKNMAPRVCILTTMHEKVTQHSYLFHLSRSWFSLGFWQKGCCLFSLQLSHNYIKPFCQFFLLYAV